jgi:hypothetical protein
MVKTGSLHCDVGRNSPLIGDDMEDRLLAVNYVIGLRYAYKLYSVKDNNNIYAEIRYGKSLHQIGPLKEMMSAFVKIGGTKGQIGYTTNLPFDSQ